MHSDFIGSLRCYACILTIRSVLKVSQNPKERGDKMRKTRPALTPESREQQLISKAVDLAERQIDEGTASSQIIVHFLKLGTEKAKLEREKLKQENLLTQAKIESLQSAARVEELYSEAINAMRRYSGHGSDPDE